jgi:hypothetical protein
MHMIKAGTELLTRSVPRFAAGSLTAEPLADTPAPQGTRKPREAILTSARSANDIAWLASVIPQMTMLRVAGAPPNAVVKRFVAKLGPKTGAPPVIEGRFLHMDASDARVQLEVAPA